MGVGDGHLVCHDARRDRLFALAWSEGQGNTLGGASTGLSAFEIAGATKTAITFNPSEA